ncbi:acyl-CoA N-acyltransferase [Daedaleopsis nitida]|nr:acyl-CoA N-acyltransferase [Daedaleopsis nitida]
MMSNAQFHPLEFNPKTGEPFLRLSSPHDNIIITPPRLSDAPAILSNMTDPAVYLWLEGPPHPYLPKHADSWLAHIKPDTDAAFQELQRASTDKPDGPPVLVSQCPVRTIREVREDGSDLFLGDIALLRERWPDMEEIEAKTARAASNAARVLGDPEIIWCIGDYIAASHQGKGIMSAVVRTLLEKWAIPRMGVRQVRVETFEENLGSRRVFEKNGFVFEKTVPVHKVLNTGRIVKGMDILWYRIPEQKQA